MTLLLASLFATCLSAPEPCRGTLPNLTGAYPTNDREWVVVLQRTDADRYVCDWIRMEDGMRVYTGSAHVLPSGNLSVYWRSLFAEWQSAGTWEYKRTEAGFSGFGGCDFEVRPR